MSSFARQESDIPTGPARELGMSEEAAPAAVRTRRRVDVVARLAGRNPDHDPIPVDFRERDLDFPEA